MPPNEFPAAGVDFERANAARMYDYMLGGGHNFAVDRAQVDRLVAHSPGAREGARANRDFLGRVVRWCVEHGIDQFLDLGSGVPTVGNVHEIAHAIDPGVRVAYVDFEPVAVMHSREILAGLDTVSITAADLREPDGVLAAPGVGGLLDLTRPVALLTMAVLHFVPGEVATIMDRYRAALCPGSAVALSHASDDQDDPALGARLRAGSEAYRGSATETTLRSRTEIRRLLAGVELVDPGLVDITDWPVPRPEVPPVGGYGAVGLLPGR